MNVECRLRVFLNMFWNSTNENTRMNAEVFPFYRYKTVRTEACVQLNLALGRIQWKWVRDGMIENILSCICGQSTLFEKLILDMNL